MAATALKYQVEMKFSLWMRRLTHKKNYAAMSIKQNIVHITG